MIKHFTKHIIKTCTTLLMIVSGSQLFAMEYPLPPPGNRMIGEVQMAKAHFGDNTASVSSRYNLGLNSIVAANPGTTEYTLNSRNLVIPTAFILPPLPYKGMIINLPEMRLYYYPENGDKVITYPIGIGKIGNTIPIQNTTITRKKLNPSWTPGPDARKYNEMQGVNLPRVLPPGPDNPLGHYAIYLNIPSFLLHSTVAPESIGRRASFGCIRMNETDIQELFPIIQAGTEVQIINMPNKVSWVGDKLYLEAHPLLDEHDKGMDTNLDDIVAAINSQLPKGSNVLIDWQFVAHLAGEPDGVPHEIGMKMKG
jgi:L,D-transpeptidase ErfK/SrfK